MKRTIIFSVILLTLTTFGYTAPTMTMTTSKSGTASILLAGSGSCTIDWGDGSAVETHTLQAPDEQGWAGEQHTFTHRYSRGSARTISITGENITHFNCWRMEATDLNVSENAVLTELICYRNVLSALNVSKNTALTRLYCNDNQIAELDVSTLAALIYLDCYSNELKHLDISKNAKLETLNCDENHLTTLDASANPVLGSLSCRSNQFTVAALDALLKSLHNNEMKIKVAHIQKNPGSEGCNTAIGKDKQWTVWN
jgi:Leucine-rich repeat (LRR) protein